MSWTHVLTTHEFWAGVPIGAVVTGVIAPIITARSVRASDRRKAEQEDQVKEKERRQAKIEAWRDGINRLSRVEAAGRRMWSLTSSLEDTEVLRESWFSSLRDAMSDEARVKADTLARWSPDNRPPGELAELLIAEVNRLERQWKLT